MSALESLRKKLATGATVMIDGATGTELQHRGVAMHDAVWCAMATATAPQVLRKIHEDYIEAGAEVIFTNTFSSSLNMLGPAGLASHFESLNRDAVALAREARCNTGSEQRVVIAGSVSHQVPMHVGRSGPRSRDDLPPATRIRANAEAMISILVDAGVDLIGLEMMYDPQLALPTMQAAFDSGVPVWLGFSCRADAAGRPSACYDARVPFERVLDALLPAPADVMGVMHSNVNVTGPALALLRARSDGPLMVYPDSGYFTMPNWQFEDVISPADLVRETRSWQAQGAQVIGGCCGLGLQHMRALAGALAGEPAES